MKAVARTLVFLLASLWVPGVLVQCGGTESQRLDPQRLERPLQGEGHVGDTLVEEAGLSLRPSQSGNRFLSGWWPKRQQGDLLLTAFEAGTDQEAGAKLELVHLVARPRTLALDLSAAALTPGARVAIRAAGRDLGTLPLTDPLEIPLPADLPLGRVLVELRPSGGQLSVRDARVRPAAESGQLQWRQDELLQQGPSRIDFARRIGPGDRLIGSFQPPAGARSGQSFRVLIESSDGSLTSGFEWSASWWNQLRGRRDFEVSLTTSTPGAVDLARIRLEADGEGPPARWKNLALLSSPSTQPTSLSPSAPSAPSAPSVLPSGSSPTAPGRPTIDQPDLVVLYVMDALRADAVTHLGGLPKTTPVIDRLAREGRTFRAHRSLAPNTLPSTKALLTGEAYVEHGGWKLPASGATTLAERWRQAGYRTGLFSGNVYVGPAYGVDRGFDHVTEIPVDESEPFNRNAERLHQAALEWLASLAAGERAFIYIHAIHPHNPYDPPDPWRSELTAGVASDIDGSTRTLLSVNRRRRQADEHDRERLRRLYAAALAYNDAQLGDFLEQIQLERAQGRFPDRRPLVMVTSDHGEELFDHGGVLHGYTLYDEMIRIPLVVWSPGLVTPGEWTHPTSTLDLHATLAQLAGQSVAGQSVAGQSVAGQSLVGQPVAAPSEGRSLLPILLGQSDDSEGADRRFLQSPHLAAAASVKGGIYSIQNSRWKLIWAPRSGLDWGLGGGLGRTRSAEYLFDLENDPGELHNRAGQGDLEVAWLRSRLRGWIEAKKSGQDGSDGDGDVTIDDETRRRLEALGYMD